MHTLKVIYRGAVYQSNYHYFALVPFYKPMSRTFYIVALLMPGYITLMAQPQNKTEAAFSVPNTVKVNEQVIISNTSTGGKSFYWNFCAPSFYREPEGVNLGTFKNYVQNGAFIETAKDRGNYYSFILNNRSFSHLTVLFHGNSPLNPPKPINDIVLHEVLPRLATGFKIVQDESGWHMIVVGGSYVGVIEPSIGRLDFGNSLENEPKGVNWGNIGRMAQPYDLHLFKEEGIWYGLTFNSDSSTITRFTFGTSFSNKPKGENLGNIGRLNHPRGSFVIKEDDQWTVFVTNLYDGTLSRLSFGSSILRKPLGENLGNPGDLLHQPNDISVMLEGNLAVCIVVNGFTNDLIRIEFKDGYFSAPTSAISYGKTGAMNAPASISDIRYERDKMYVFVPNSMDNTTSMLLFKSGNESTISHASEKVPPVYSYTQPGTYYVTLLMDEGLPTEQRISKYISVLPAE